MPNAAGKTFPISAALTGPDPSLRSQRVLTSIECHFRMKQGRLLLSVMEAETPGLPSLLVQAYVSEKDTEVPVCLFKVTKCVPANPNISWSRPENIAVSK